jgi:hypothetical protein
MSHRRTGSFRDVTKMPVPFDCVQPRDCCASAASLRSRHRWDGGARSSSYATRSTAVAGGRCREGWRMTVTLDAGGVTVGSTGPAAAAATTANTIDPRIELTSRGRNRLINHSYSTAMLQITTTTEATCPPACIQSVDRLNALFWFCA